MASGRSIRAKTKGVLFVLAASFFWATDAIFFRYSSETSTALQGITSKILLICLGVMLYLPFSNAGFKKKLVLKKHEYRYLFIVTVLSLLCGEVLAYYILTKIPLLNFMVITHIQSFFIIFFTYIFLKHDMPGVLDYIGGGILFLSVMMVTSGSLAKFIQLDFGSVYNLFLLIPVIFWALTSILIKKKMSHVDSTVLTFYKYAFGIPFLVLPLLLTTGFSFNWFQVGMAVSTFVGLVLYYNGLKILKAAQVGFLELSSPIFVAVLGWLLFGENVTLFQFVAVLMLFPGVYLVAKHDGTVV